MISTLCLSLVIAISGAVGTPADVPNDLLPRPQQAEMQNGECSFDLPGLAFVLRTPTEEVADRLGGRLAEVQQRLGFRHPSIIRECPAQGFTLLVLSGNATPTTSPLTLSVDAQAEGYDLTISAEGIVIQAATEKGLFYGMMTLEQLLNSVKVRKLDALPLVHIVDWPRISMRGYHEDYGRDQLPTVEDHKRTIRILAQYKMNTHLWFIEPNHFVYSFDPEIGKEFDRFTFDEIREIVAYAKKYYVEVIPVVESLAHMEWTLNNSKYGALAESDGSGTLCPTSEESFKLIKSILDEIAPAFDSPYFHCGLDESSVVGQGKSADAVKQKGIEQVYADYYTRLHDLLKAHGKTMMMYADIVLNHPKVMDLLPKDIVMMYWEYGDAEHHAGLDTLVKSGFTTVTLAGMWDWVSLYPVYGFSFKNIERLGAQSAAVGSKGFFVSNWGDWNLGAAGANLSELTYYGAVYCGAQGWKPEPIPFEAYSAAFAAQFFGISEPAVGEGLTLLARAQGDTLGGFTKARKMSYSNPKEQIPVMGKASDDELAFWRTIKERAERGCILLRKNRALNNADYLKSHDLAARMLVFAADLALQYRVTAEAIAAGKLDTKKEAETYAAFAERQKELWKEYSATYEATNRPVNLRYLVIAFDNSIKALQAFAEELRHGKVSVTGN